MNTQMFMKGLIIIKYYFITNDELKNNKYVVNGNFITIYGKRFKILEGNNEGLKCYEV